MELRIDTASPVRLRPFVPQDAAKVFRMSREAGMQAWLPSQVYRDEAHAASVLAFLIERYAWPADPRIGPYVLGVALDRSPEVIGHVGFSPLDGAVEVGFAIEQGQQGKGCATVAVRAACAWAMREFALPAVIAVTSERNLASQGVLLRAGFARTDTREMSFQGLPQRVVLFELAGAR
jgi:RimJ/RimL family protein N-acetyltransferase